TAKGKIREGGKIMIISSRFRLARWQLDKIAEGLNLDMLVKEFNPEEWEGYEHEKTRNADAAETVRRTEQFAIILTVKAEKKDGGAPSSRCSMPSARRRSSSRTAATSKRRRATSSTSTPASPPTRTTSAC